MNNTSYPRPLELWLLVLLEVLLGLGALLGGGAFILAPDGSILQMPIIFLEKSPFSDFLIPGLILFTLIGIYPLLVAYSLWKLPAWRWPDVLNPFKQFHWSWAASLAVGVIDMIWIAVEVVWVPFGLIHVVYFAWGFLILVLTLLPGVRRYCRVNLV